MSAPIHIPGLRTYKGGKNAEGTVQTLVNLIPPHKIYIEPFLGGGAVMRHKLAADVNYGCDLDRAVVNKWKAAKLEHIDVFRGDAFDLLRIMACADATTPAECDEGHALFGLALTTVKRPSGIFIFLDPPYLTETLARGNSKPYAHMLSYDQHVELLGLIVDLPGKVMICGLPNLLYDNMLDGWHTRQYQNQTRRGPQTEQVWMNYAPPKKLHDHKHLGNDFRERLSWKRRVKRWTAKFKAMKPQQRAAMLEELQRHVKQPKP